MVFCFLRKHKQTLNFKRKIQRRGNGQKEQRKAKATGKERRNRGREVEREPERLRERGGQGGEREGGRRGRRKRRRRREGKTREGQESLCMPPSEPSDAGRLKG